MSTARTIRTGIRKLPKGKPFTIRARFRTLERHAVSTARTIRTGIRKLPKGKPFTSARFLEHGSRGTVDRTLSRLAPG